MLHNRPCHQPIRFVSTEWTLVLYFVQAAYSPPYSSALLALLYYVVDRTVTQCTPAREWDALEIYSSGRCG